MNGTKVAAVKEASTAIATRVIVADDEESMRYFVTRALTRHGYNTVAFDSGEKAIAEFDARPADVAVVDLKMPGADGLEVLAELRKRDPEVIVILMTAFGSIATAVEAMRRGAHDYLTKPFERDELILLIERALEHRATVRENKNLRHMVDHRGSFCGLIGESPAMKTVYQTIEHLQESDVTVLITGESGTGKELVARAIHMGSRRSRNPFIPVHCASLVDNLVESELFGYVPGAFTGAKRAKQGLVARAVGGTLFLDEIAEASLHAQSKLERFLQEREYLPVGATDAVEVDLRIVAATNKDIDLAVESGQVRPELLFRLNVVELRLPPLRERQEDIPALVSHFLERLSSRGASIAHEFSADAMVAMSRYAWPGNVRELQNKVERLVALNPRKEILTLDDLPEEVLTGDDHGLATLGSSRPSKYQDAIELAERAYFKDLLRRTSGNVTEAAAVSGMSRGHLHRKLSHLGLDPATFRA